MMVAVVGQQEDRYDLSLSRLRCFVSPIILQPPPLCLEPPCVCVRAAVIKLGKNAWVIRGFHEMYLSQNMDVIKVNRLARYFIVLLSSLKYILRYISYEILKWG